ncbi:MAG: hypothetical protein OEZ13_00365 [Spirochaetia bacterium]|nr:hypothetical protein [Spirochaetia bacterium]
MSDSQKEILHADFQKADFKYLIRLQRENKLSQEICERLLDYYKSRISNKSDKIYTNYFEYYLFFEFINSAVIGAFFYGIEEKDVFLQYGILNDVKSEILKTLKKKVNFVAEEKKEIDETLDFLYHSENFACRLKKVTSLEKEYVLIVLYPKALDIRDRLERLERVFLRYYLPDTFKADKRFSPLFEDVNKTILEKINPALENDQPVTFSFYKFENFEKYMEFGGEFFSRQLIGEIQKEFISRMKATDKCFILSPREYLIVSVNCEIDDIKDRFSKMAFKAKSLILAYKVKYSTFFEPIEHLSEKWKQISIQK